MASTCCWKATLSGDLKFMNERNAAFNPNEIENRMFIEDNYGMMKILNLLHNETIGVNADG